MRIESQTGVWIGGPNAAPWPIAPVREPARCREKGLEGLPGPITVLTWAAAQQVGDALKASRDQRAVTEGLAIDYADWLRRANRELPSAAVPAATAPERPHARPATEPAASTRTRVPLAGPTDGPALLPGPAAKPSQAAEPWDAVKPSRRPAPGIVQIIRPVPNPVGRLIDLVA